MMRQSAQTILVISDKSDSLEPQPIGFVDIQPDDLPPACDDLLRERDRHSESIGSQLDQVFADVQAVHAAIQRTRFRWRIWWSEFLTRTHGTQLRLHFKVRNGAESIIGAEIERIRIQHQVFVEMSGLLLQKRTVNFDDTSVVKDFMRMRFQRLKIDCQSIMTDMNTLMAETGMRVPDYYHAHAAVAEDTVR